MVRITDFQASKCDGGGMDAAHPLHFIHDLPFPSEIGYLAVRSSIGGMYGFAVAAVFDLPIKPFTTALAIRALVLGMIDLGFTYYIEDEDLGKLNYAYQFSQIFIHYIALNHIFINVTPLNQMAERINILAAFLLLGFPMSFCAYNMTDQFFDG